MFFFRVIIIFLLIIPLFADIKIHLYYYNFPSLTIEEIQQPLIRKKYRDYFLHFYEIHKFYSKEEISFFYIGFPNEISDLRAQNFLKESIQFYLYVLKNYQFDGISFFSIQPEVLNQEIYAIIDQIKPYREKIICFDCLEGFSYLYQRNLTNSFQKIKIMNIFFKNCEIYDETLKKLLYLHEDTNLWNLYINNHCLKNEVIEHLKRENKKTFFLFLGGKNEFYKINKNSNIYICHTESNFFCKITLHFREKNIISVAQNFIELF